MSTEDKLKNLILERYSSISEFSRKCDLSNTTVDSILKRGIHKSTLDKVMSICKTLHISADELYKGNIVSTFDKKTTEDTTEIMDILEIAKQQLLSNRALMFNGKPADEESIQSILSAMEIGMEMAKRKGE